MEKEKPPHPEAAGKTPKIVGVRVEAKPPSLLRQDNRPAGVCKPNENEASYRLLARTPTTVLRLDFQRNAAVGEDVNRKIYQTIAKKKNRQKLSPQSEAGEYDELHTPGSNGVFPAGSEETEAGFTSKK